MPDYNFSEHIYAFEEDATLVDVYQDILFQLQGMYYCTVDAANLAGDYIEISTTACSNLVDFYDGVYDNTEFTPQYRTEVNNLVGTSDMNNRLTLIQNLINAIQPLVP